MPQRPNSDTSVIIKNGCEKLKQATKASNGIAGVSAAITPPNTTPTTTRGAARRIIPVQAIPCATVIKIDALRCSKSRCCRPGRSPTHGPRLYVAVPVAVNACTKEQEPWSNICECRTNLRRTMLRFQSPQNTAKVGLALPNTASVARVRSQLPAEGKEISSHGPKSLWGRGCRKMVITRLSMRHLYWVNQLPLETYTFRRLTKRSSRRTSMKTTIAPPAGTNTKPKLAGKVDTGVVGGPGKMATTPAQRQPHQPDKPIPHNEPGNVR